VNSSLIHSDRVFRSGVTPNPSKFGAGISGEGWAPACLCISSTVNPILGDWGSIVFPSKFMTGGEPLGFRSEALLDGLLLGRLSVPSGFFLGARLDFLQYRARFPLLVVLRPLHTLLLTAPCLTDFCWLSEALAGIILTPLPF
jgi:hypothetical protein